MATPKTETLRLYSYGSVVGMPQLCGEWMSNQILACDHPTGYLLRSVAHRAAAHRRGLAERQGTITTTLLPPKI